MFDLILIVAVTVIMLRSNIKLERTHSQMKGLGKELNYLFFYHVAFIGIFTVYILKFGGDSLSYWQFEKDLGPIVTAHYWTDYFGFGTLFIEFICYIPVKIMDLSYVTGNFLFGMLGFLGMRFLYLLLRQTIPVNVNVWGIRVIPFLFYLPNLNFWISGVGKDVLCFFAIAWFLYSLQFYKKKWIGMIMSFTLAFFVRPHIGVLMIAGALLSILVSGNVKMGYKIIFSFLIVTTFYLLYDFVAKYLKIGDLNTGTLASVAKTQAINLGGKDVRSSIDFENYSWPMKVFSFLFRPFFFDARDVMSFSISIENFLYFVIMIRGILAFKRKYVAQLPIWLKAGFIIFIFSVIVFSNSLSNLGIIIRMKNMTMIYFIMIWLYFISVKQSLKMVKRVSPKRAKPIKYTMND